MRDSNKSDLENWLRDNWPLVLMELMAVLLLIPIVAIILKTFWVR